VVIATKVSPVPDWKKAAPEREGFGLHGISGSHSFSYIACLILR